MNFDWPPNSLRPRAPRRGYLPPFVADGFSANIPSRRENRCPVPAPIAKHPVAERREGGQVHPGMMAGDHLIHKNGGLHKMRP